MAMNIRIPGSDSRRLALRAAATMLTMALQACAPLQRLGPVPEAQTEQAVIAGMPDSRIWTDRDLTAFVKLVLADNARERSALLQAGLPIDPMPPVKSSALPAAGDNAECWQAFWQDGLPAGTARSSRSSPHQGKRPDCPARVPDRLMTM